MEYIKDVTLFGLSFYTFGMQEKCVVNSTSFAVGFAQVKITVDRREMSQRLFMPKYLQHVCDSCK